MPDNWIVEVGSTAVVGGGTPTTPGNVTLGTPKVSWLYKEGAWQVKITVPVTAPSPIGSFDRMFVFLQAPDDAVSTQKATISDSAPGFYISGNPDDASRIVSISEPEAKIEIKWNPAEPVISITHPEPTGAEKWRIIVASGSPYVKNAVNRADGPSPTPSVLVDVDVHPEGVPGSEVGPQARNLQGTAKYRYGKGAEQYWRPSLVWALPSDDPEFEQLDYWDIWLYDPTLADLESTPQDDRLRGPVATVGANDTSWILGVQPGWPVPDNPVDFDFFLVAGNKDGDSNSIVRGVTAQCTIRVERQSVEAGTEAAGVVKNLAATWKYAVDPSTGRKQLAIHVTCDQPDADTRWGGWIVDFKRSDYLTDFPDFRPVTGIQTGGETDIAQNELPTSTITFWLAVRSVDANGDENSYVSGVTPEIALTIDPPTVASRLKNVTNFTVTYEYSDPDYARKTVLMLYPHFVKPADPQWVCAEFWCLPPWDDAFWVNLGFPSAPGTDGAATIERLPRATGTWKFAFVSQDVDSLNADGDEDTHAPSWPAGTPTFNLEIPALNTASPLGNATGFSVAALYMSADYYGKKALRITPTFTRPDDDRVASFEFWGQPASDSVWRLLNEPSTSGTDGAAIVYDLPTADGTWHFALVSQDINSMNSDGDVETHSPTWPTGTPTATLLITAPTGKQDGTKIQNLDVAAFAAGLRPVGLGPTRPTLPSTLWPAGSSWWDTSVSPPKEYRVDTAGTTWTAQTDGADIKARSITGASLVVGAVSTSELFAGEFLLGQGGGKPTRFKIVAADNSLVAFMGDDPSIPFNGIFTKRLKVAPGILSTSPRIEMTAAGSIEIEGATFLLNSNSVIVKVDNSTSQAAVQGLQIYKSDNTQQICLRPGFMSMHPNTTSGTTFYLSAPGTIDTSMSLYATGSLERIRMNAFASGGQIAFFDSSNIQRGVISDRGVTMLNGQSTLTGDFPVVTPSGTKTFRFINGSLMYVA